MTPARLVKQAHRWILRRPYRGPLVIGAAGFAAAAAVSLAFRWPPAPIIHDEFSYLLASDTFAHGRLANPTHPFWQHFESFHILQVPTYASKYPPGSALFLALGQVLTGQPIVGVWISYALMCAAVTWMLQAWLRPRWALWGGMLAMVWFVDLAAGGVYWASSYWGGATAAAAAALVLGGLERIRRSRLRPRVRDSLAVGAGLLLLANTRPLEGLFYSLPLLSAMLWWLWKTWSTRGWRSPIGGAMPALAVLLAGALFMARYNRAVTGNAFRFPYVAYEQQYDPWPLLLWQKAPPAPSYHHEVMRCFYLTESGHAERPHSFWQYLASLYGRSKPLIQGLSPLFALPLLLGLPWVLRHDRPWLPLTAMGASLVSLLGNPWYLNLHYAAPLVGAYFLLLTLSARRLAVWRVGRRRFGAALGRLVMVLAGMLAVGSIVGIAILKPRPQNAWYEQRAAIQAELSRTPGRHLVLVQYGPHHRPAREWVYDEADIDGSRVVWARAMGAAADASLLRYFSDRRAWLLRVDEDDGPFNLVPTSRTTLPADENPLPSAGNAAVADSIPPETCRQ